MTTKLERDFQAQLIKDLREMFPGCTINKQDTRENQAIPDLLILWNDRWAMLECKRASTSALQANQDWYIEHFNEMSFAAFIYPENRQEVLDALQSALRATR